MANNDVTAAINIIFDTPSFKLKERPPAFRKNPQILSSEKSRLHGARARLGASGGLWAAVKFQVYQRVKLGGLGLETKWILLFQQRAVRHLRHSARFLGRDGGQLLVRRL
ncbi:hypothetical protein PS2_001982 [Malus domestica]